MKILANYLIILFFILGCQNKKTSLNPPYSAEIIFIDLSTPQNSPSSVPTYTLGITQFEYLKNLNELNGPYFKIFQGGSIFVDHKGEVRFIASNKTHLNYRLFDNVIIPQDYSTLVMLSAYYQFDVIAKNLMDLTGISISEVVNKFGRFDIYFEPNIQIETKGTFVRNYEKENASYIPQFHKFMLYLRSKNEGVPLPSNLQVITHEFGHTMWQYLVGNNNSEHCDRLDAEYAIAGLNEGFGDFFSYSLTGSSNILYASLDSKELEHMRDFSKIKFDYKLIANIANQQNAICDQSFYCIGTLFANALFKTQRHLGYHQNILYGSKSRSEFLKKIVSALQNTREKITHLPTVPHDFDSCVIARNKTTPAYDGIILGLFFRAFLSEISDKLLQNELCGNLAQNFNELGFATQFRKDFCL